MIRSPRSTAGPAKQFRALAISASLPDLGIASRVVDSVDDYLFAVDLVQDLIGKAMHQSSSHLPIIAGYR